MRYSRARTDSANRIRTIAFLCAYAVGVILEPDLFTDAVNVYVSNLPAVPVKLTI